MNLLNNTEVGERLRVFREGLNTSSRKFAMKANIDPSQYAKIESGLLPLSEKILLKLLFTYKQMDKDYILFGRKERMETNQNKMVSSVKSNEVLFVADGIIKLIPKVSSAASPEQQVVTLKEQVNKYLMVIDLLKSAVTGLQTDIDQLRKTKK